jgi:predicted ribosome quality control (RQC) complex YloA/Tae2 family protein
MLSLRELQRAAEVLDHQLSGSYLQRIVQIGDARLYLTFGGLGAKQTVMFCCKPEFARVCLTKEIPEAPASTPSFLQYLRAHLARARFAGVRPWEYDRLIAFRLETPDGSFDLIFSVLGSRSNIYLIDLNGILLHTMRPLEKTRRELAVGKPWTDPCIESLPRERDRWLHVGDCSYLEAISDHYQALERKREVEVLSRRMETTLARELNFLERKAVNLQEDLTEARQAEELGRKGELLKGVLHLIKPGDSLVTATNYETGESLIIPIDPKLSAAKNLEAYFSRYQKDLRGISAIQQQMLALEKSRSRLEGLRNRLRQLLQAEEIDLSAARSLTSEPAMRRLLARHYPVHKTDLPPIRSTKRTRIPSSLRPKRYRSESGLEIWVGRNEEGNDYLTTRLAHGNDLFFHLEGYPGSHVVLRTQGNANPPSEAVLDACELAVHFSKQREVTRADVHVAPVKYVRKPRGAKPGLVFVSKGRTIHLRRDPKRLESILAARLDLDPHS